MKTVYNHAEFRDLFVIYYRSSPIIKETTSELLEHVADKVSRQVFQFTGDTGVRANIGQEMEHPA